MKSFAFLHQAASLLGALLLILSTVFSVIDISYCQTIGNIVSKFLTGMKTFSTSLESRVEGTGSLIIPFLCQ